MRFRALALTRVVSVLLVTLLLASPVATPSRAAEGEKFGTVDFATSCSAEAQAPFKVGVARASRHVHTHLTRENEALTSPMERFVSWRGGRSRNGSE